MKKDELLTFVDMHEAEMISLWQTLVNHDSGTEDKSEIDLLQAKIGDILKALGAEVRFVEHERAGNLLIAELGKQQQVPPLVFLGHVDTVFKKGTAGKRSFSIKNGKAFGPGVLDMKGGIVVLLYAIKALLSINYTHRPLKVILAGDEENGHQKSSMANVLQQECEGARAVFNCETGFMDNSIVIGRRGVATFTIETFGIAAHVGNARKDGRSAVVEIAHKILAIENLNDKSGNISFNVGTIEGGTVPNAVPDYAKIRIDVRFDKEAEVEIFHKQLEVITEQVFVEGTYSKLQQDVCFKPMETTDDVSELFEFVQKVAEENNLGHLKPCTVGGASDSAYAVSSGSPTVCGMGVKGAYNHSPNEYALVDSLYERTKLLALIVYALDEEERR